MNGWTKRRVNEGMDGHTCRNGQTKNGLKDRQMDTGGWMKDRCMNGWMVPKVTKTSVRHMLTNSVVSML